MLSSWPLTPPCLIRLPPHQPHRLQLFFLAWMKWSLLLLDAAEHVECTGETIQACSRRLRRLVRYVGVVLDKTQRRKVSIKVSTMSAITLPYFTPEKNFKFGLLFWVSLRYRARVCNSRPASRVWKGGKQLPPPIRCGTLLHFNYVFVYLDFRPRDAGLLTKNCGLLWS